MKTERDRGPSSLRRATCIALALAAGCGLGVGLAARAEAAIDARPSAPGDAHDANTVKSAFVYNFAARHVKWPEPAHRDKTSPFVVGVLGTDAITAPLIETCRGRKSGERPIEVRTLDGLASISNCHILLVPMNREAEMPAILAACKGHSILIVGSSEEAVRKGAHIGFFLEKSKVRFAAEPQTAKTAGLEISSELLKLARVVEKKAGSPP